MCRALRLQYDVALGGPLAPTAEEVHGAWDDLRAGLRGAGIAATSSAEVVRAARDVLLAHDVVFLPPAGPSADEGDFVLARVTARQVGLEREVAGRVVRYRRVEHEGVLLLDLTSYAALRAGHPASIPLTRAAGPTVFVDRLAVERQAGRGSAAHLDADALAAEAELRQVAAMRFADDLREAAVLPPPAAARLRVVHHASLLLAAAIEGDARYGLGEVERLVRTTDVAPEVALGARAAAEALADTAPTLAPAERARRALARLRAGA